MEGTLGEGAGGCLVRACPHGKQQSRTPKRMSCFGTPEVTRTPNPQNRNLMRYPLRYWRMCCLIAKLL